MIEPISLPKSGIDYRELTAEEIQTVVPIFEAQQAALPDPRVSTFVGAVENGKVVGFLVLQQRLHAEPFWLEEGKSHSFVPLVRKTEEVVLARCGPQYVYTFTPAGKITQLAASMGMQMEPWVVMSKLVMPETPKRTTVELMPEPQPIVSPEELESVAAEGGVQ